MSRTTRSKFWDFALFLSVFSTLMSAGPARSESEVNEAEKKLIEGRNTLFDAIRQEGTTEPQRIKEIQSRIIDPLKKQVDDKASHAQTKSHRVKKGEALSPAQAPPAATSRQTAASKKRGALSAASPHAPAPADESPEVDGKDVPKLVDFKRGGVVPPDDDVRPASLSEGVDQIEFRKTPGNPSK